MTFNNNGSIDIFGYFSLAFLPPTVIVMCLTHTQMDGCLDSLKEVVFEMILHGPLFFYFSPKHLYDAVAIKLPVAHDRGDA